MLVGLVGRDRDRKLGARGFRTACGFNQRFLSLSSDIIREREHLLFNSQRIQALQRVPFDMANSWMWQDWDTVMVYWIIEREDGCNDEECDSGYDDEWKDDWIDGWIDWSDDDWGMPTLFGPSSTAASCRRLALVIGAWPHSSSIRLGVHHAWSMMCEEGLLCL